MCGLIFNISNDSPIDRERFNKARDTMYHRGPDASGTVILGDGRIALGHRRLSIMDLTEAGNQPMQLDTLHVVFNGEIYNYPELRTILQEKGCHFKTHCDTEVLLHGYRVWGKELCTHLSGMFAFVIWDDEKKEIFIARDHVGQKPLYYSQTGHQLIVASEIKAIKSLNKTSMEMRKESIIDFQFFEFVPEPYTWYRDIKCVLPGHAIFVQVKNNSYEMMPIQYWNFTPDPDPAPITEDMALDIIGEEIEKAIKSHLLADVEVGAFLSGGADSTAIVATASQYLNQPIKTFSIGFGNPDGDELPLARETANRIGTTHTEGLVSEEDFRASMNSLLDVFDQPFSDTSLVPTERVSALAVKDVKVVLTGDGGDEAFGGYDYGWYISPFLESRAKRLNSLGGIKNYLLSYMERFEYLALGADKWRNNHKNLFRRRRSRSRINNLFGHDIAAELQDYDPTWVYKKHRNQDIDSFREIQWLGIKIFLPNQYLVKVDRSSMKHSLEARAPFLSHTLLETMLNLPTNIRNPENNWYKGLFRTWLKDKIPDNVLNAPKRGFAIPYTWQPVPSSEHAAKYLRRCIDASFVNPASMARITREPKVYWKFLQLEAALEKGLF